MAPRYQRILHVDGDAFFASCEIALDPALRNRPVYVGGGRRGDGIVIAANYIAKRYGLITGMACFEARRKCPEGVLVRPHYNEYRRLSLEMFSRLKNYTPMLVPTSIDEGFLDFTDSPRVFGCCTAAELAERIRRQIVTEVGVPISAGLGSSRWLAKLATEHCKPNGFLEVPADGERAFLAPVPVKKLSGIAERRARALRSLGVRALGDVARLPLEMLRRRFGVFGLELWLLARGELHETLSLANNARTCISSATTLPWDEPDCEAALLFLLDQTERVITTFFRENLKAREMGVFVRFCNFEGVGRSVRFPSAQFEPRVIDPVVEQMFRELVAGQHQPIRQVCIHFCNFEPLDLQPDLFGEHPEFKRREMHHALEEIETRYGPRSIKSGTRLLAESQAAHLLGDKAKCPFVPQREMEIKVGQLPETLCENALDPVYEEDWLPLESDESRTGSGPLPLPRTWGRSTSRATKLG
ncbi:MAG: DNA polymerase IV [Verrucomicrobia bacterium]|nr:DNA polymerase IV [Verrucomicrobiota bacterium]